MIAIVNSCVKCSKFDEQLCSYLEILSSLDASLVLQCCQISLKLLDDGKYLSPKQLSKAAVKLGIVPHILDKCLHALASLFLTASKLSRSPKRLITSLSLLGIPHAEVLVNFWSQQVHPKIRAKLDAKSDHYKHVQDINWTLDVIIQTRAQLVMQPEPVVNLKLINEHEVISFEAEIHQMMEMSASLEQALKTLKSKEEKMCQKYL